MACSICGQAGHTKRTHDRDVDQEAGYWFQEGWMPRRRGTPTTDHPRAERIRMAHAARRKALGQVVLEVDALNERIRDLEYSYARAWEPIGQAFLRLAVVAGRRIGRHRTKELDAAIDDVLGARLQLARDLARLRRYGADDEDDDPLAQDPGDAVG